MPRPPGNFFTMFHFLEYPFSRGRTHIASADPYAAPDFDAGFMSDERDMAPMVWGYIKSRETARRMDAYAGEVQALHPLFDYGSPARAHDLSLADTLRYALSGNITAGIQHGSWSVPVPEPDERPPGREVVTSSRKEKRRELRYSRRDIEAIEEWVKRHVETTWHCLGVSLHTSMDCSVELARSDCIIYLFWPRPAPWRPATATTSSSTASSTSASTCTASRASRWPT